MSHAPLPLEDLYNDVLMKATRGLALTRDELARRASLTTERVSALLAGEVDEAALAAVAPVLGLGGEQLAALARGRYQPEVAPPAGLLGISTPFDDFHVNAYLVWDPATRQAIAFDTGSTAAPLLEAARTHNLDIALILLTHTHHDHIMALGELAGATQAPAYISDVEPAPGATPVPAGHRFKLGCLEVEARRTRGHTHGGTSYVVTGLERPLVVVGDALFAGSMGGGNVSYPDALATNRSQLFSLTDDTIVCPGHGPLTTIGLERQHNPFYPEQRG